MNLDTFNVLYKTYLLWIKMPLCKECGKPVYALFKFKCSHTKSSLFVKLMENASNR